MVALTAPRLCSMCSSTRPRAERMSSAEARVWLISRRSARTLGSAGGMGRESYRIVTRISKRDNGRAKRTGKETETAAGRTRGRGRGRRRRRDRGLRGLHGEAAVVAICPAEAPPEFLEEQGAAGHQRLVLRGQPDRVVHLAEIDAHGKGRHGRAEPGAHLQGREVRELRADDLLLRLVDPDPAAQAAQVAVTL